MPVSNDQIEIILAEMKRGYDVRIGGSRCHTYFCFKDESWFEGSFDEGYREERSCTEAAIVQRIHANQRHFVGLLRLPHKRAVGQALRRGDHPGALRALEAWEQGGDSQRDAAVLRAYLQWPSVTPSEDIKASIRSRLRCFTAYHVIMRFLDYEKTVENGRLGLHYVEALGQIVGDCQGWFSLRASFREMSGDIPGAIADLQTHLENLPKALLFEVSHLEERIARLRAAVADPQV